jgi:hypothetical protein
MEAVEIARKLIVRFENISVYKVTYRLPDGSTYDGVRSVIAPQIAAVRDEVDAFSQDR